MNGHDYYQELPDNSEQSLETDVMRFIAIIGIIFWLIFSITSALPQPEIETKPKPKNSQAPVLEVAQNQPEVVKPETATAELKIKPEPRKLEIQTLQKPPVIPSPEVLKPKPTLVTKPKIAVPKPIMEPKIEPKKKIVKPVKINPETLPEAVKERPRKNPPPKPTKEPIKNPVKEPVKPKSPPQKSELAPKTQPVRKTGPQPQPQTKTLSIEFRTLNDLLTLLTKKSVTVFCQIKAPGFDLLFRNDRLNPERLPIYASTTTIPPILWEIKETKTRSFFLTSLQKNFPATGNFPDRKVFVAFADAGLEQNIEKILKRLRAEKRGGTIIISGDGTLKVPEPT